jgi:hypothetical protein
MVLWAPAPPPPPLRAGEMPQRTEWFVSNAPPSPLSAVLDGLPYDSLSPLDVGAPVGGGVPVLEARVGRAGEARPVAALRTTGGVRQLRVSGSGYASWIVRGGRSADAFSAFWGAIFDWMAVAEGDGTTVMLGNRLVRAGDEIAWRRGTADSVATVVLRAASGSVDTLDLSFSSDADVLRTPSLPEGTYDVQAGASSRRLVVNPSREWVPRAPVSAPEVRAAEPSLGASRPLLERSWPFVFALVLLCSEWLLRRAAGLR